MALAALFWNLSQMQQFEVRISLQECNEMLSLFLAAAGLLVAICALALAAIEQEEPKPVFHNSTSRSSVYHAWNYLDGS